MKDNIILSLKNITKTYPGVVALDDVSIDFKQGEIHALLGENGAGKSTLIKTISGAIAPDIGSIEFGESKYEHMTPIIAKNHGVEVVYQESNLVEPLSVAENIYLDQKFGKSFNKKIIEDKTRELFRQLNIDIDPAQEVERLSPAKKQLVEICKSISRDVKILVLDEPTAPLTSSEVETMFGIIDDLKRKGVTIIYISHRLEELFRITDRVTVLRDGKYITTVNTCETDRQQLVSFMVGRQLKESYPLRTNKQADVALEVKNLSGNGDTDISFKVCKGEIFGLAGLVGSGRTEIINVIFGAAPMESGEIIIGNEKAKIKSPSDAIKYGMGLIPEDRKFLGCLQELSIGFNISLTNIKNLSKFSIISSRKENNLVQGYIEKLKIKTPSGKQKVKNLSGGNQQKVVLAKSMAAEPNIYIFDEPTRGIDVGAKQEIYNLMNDLADHGKAIIMVSSELEELIGICDRIGVLYEGTYRGEVEKKDFDSKLIIGLASGMSREEIKC